MQSGWLKSAGMWTIEHVPCPHPNVAVDTSVPPKGVQHTTEGSTVEGALSKFKSVDAPHFLLGRDQKNSVRVLQLIPLGYIAAALEHHGDPPTNGYVRAQIELAGFSKHSLWKPDTEVLSALGALYGALAQAQGIPLKHVANPTRNPSVWRNEAGWFGHDGAPNQWTGHWDPGVLDYQAVFAHASRGIPVPVAKAKPKPLVLHPRTFTLVRRANGLVYAENIERPH